MRPSLDGKNVSSNKKIKVFLNHHLKFLSSHTHTNSYHALTWLSLAGKNMYKETDAEQTLSSSRQAVKKRSPGSCFLRSFLVQLVQ